MASRTGYFDRTNNQWLSSATETAAIASNGKIPFIRYREQLVFNLEVKTVSGNTVSDYTGWATDGPYTFAMAVANNYTHKYDGTLNGALSAGVITAVIADGLSVTPDVNGGSLILKNAAGQQETVAYTSYTVIGGVYTFAVSATLTYSYADDDACNYVDPVMVAVTNANIDQTNAATGKLAITMDGDTVAMLAAVQGAPQAAGVRFEIQVYDISGKIVDTIGGDWQALNILWDEMSIPPSAPASNHYTTTQSDARYMRDFAAIGDVGEDLADADMLVVYDDSAATTAKSAMSRVWTYVTGKVATVGLASLVLLDTSADHKYTVVPSELAADRTVTLPLLASNDTLVMEDHIQTLGNKTLDNSNTITVLDTLFAIQDEGDASKQVQFQLSGLTTATTRTITMADRDVSLATMINGFSNLTTQYRLGFVNAPGEMTESSTIKTDVNGTLLVGAGASQATSEVLTVSGKANIDGIVIASTSSPTDYAYYIGSRNTDNWFSGRVAGGAITTGIRNQGFGNQALANITSGSNNAAMGHDAMPNATTAYWNSAMGYESLLSMISSGACTAFGYQSLRSCTANSNTAVGAGAGYAVSTGTLNTMMGASAGKTATTTSEWTAIGAEAAALSTGRNFAALGRSAGYANTANDWTAIGFKAGMFLSDGSTLCTSSAQSLYVGAESRASAATGLTNEMVVGRQAVGNGSNTATWGNAAITDHYFSGFLRLDTAQGLKVNGTQVVTDQQSALTAQLTTITHTAPGTPDYAFQDMTNTTPYGFVTQDEANSLLAVVANLQTRVAELETKLKTHGLIA